MVTELEELRALVQAKFIVVQVVIKKFAWAHHMLLLGLRMMQKPDAIGIHLVGNHVIIGRQKLSELAMPRDINLFISK